MGLRPQGWKTLSASCWFGLVLYVSFKYVILQKSCDQVLSTVRDWHVADCMDLSIDSRSLVWWRTPAALTWLWIRTLLFSFTRFGWSLAAPLRSQTCFGTADFFFTHHPSTVPGTAARVDEPCPATYNPKWLHAASPGTTMLLMENYLSGNFVEQREWAVQAKTHTHTHTYRCKMVWRTKETQMQWRRVVKIRTWIWQVCGPE